MVCVPSSQAVIRFATIAGLSKEDFQFLLLTLRRVKCTDHEQPDAILHSLGIVDMK
jgi:hypothetical protein